MARVNKTVQYLIKRIKHDYVTYSVTFNREQRHLRISDAQLGCASLLYINYRKKKNYYLVINV